MARTEAQREKRGVALYSIIASIFMIAGKGTVGLMTGSLALLTDALHSFLDLSASTITYFAVRISDKPADREHHFGHGKVESLAALAEVVLLFATCGFIGYEAVTRLMSGSSPVILNIWAYIVIIVSIGIDISRVSVKATTSEHLGFAGRGEGIAVYAVALIEGSDNEGI